NKAIEGNINALTAFKCYLFVSFFVGFSMFCAYRQAANFSLYSSHTQGQQLPPPQHSSDFGFSGFCGN
ncbi:MAG: hypothetical protein ACI9W0_003531, partial [Gammaproteobacteria bacterium]